MNKVPATCIQICYKPFLKHEKSIQPSDPLVMVGWWWWPSGGGLVVVAWWWWAGGGGLVGEVGIVGEVVMMGEVVDEARWW